MKLKVSVFLLLITGFGLTCKALGAEGTSDVNSLATLDDYLVYAEHNNAGLKASFEEWQGAAEQIPQAKALPDPELSYAYATRPTPQRSIFEATQTFPWFGTLDERGAAAAAGEKAAEKRYRAQRLKLFAELKKAYYDYSYLARQIDIARENTELLKHFEEVTRVRYATSQTGHPDHIRAEIEVANAQYELQILGNQQEPFVARLNSILDRPAMGPLAWPARTEFKKIQLNHSEIIALVIKNNPELQALNFEIEVARRQVELAKKRFYPEFGIGVAVDAGMGRNDSSRTMPKVEITLPIWRDSYSAGQRQAEAGQRKATQQKTESQNNTVARTASTIYDFESSTKRVELYGNILIPRTRELLKASEAAYSSGTIDFLALIDAERLLLQYRLEYERAITENVQKAAELEELCGTELPAAVKQ